MSVYAKKSLGQNFLNNAHYQEKIIKAILSVNEKPLILEIGPGRGAITQHLVPASEKFWAVEKDKELGAALAEKYSAVDHVKICIDDFLKVDLGKLFETRSPGQKIIAVGNLPYNVGSQILIKLLPLNDLFSHLFLMFQKEVAERCVAKAGTRDFGVLSAWVQLYSKASLLFKLPPNAFSPAPKVDSAFVSFELAPRYQAEQNRVIIELIKKAFQTRRKMLGTSLKAWRKLDPAWDQEFEGLWKKRPEELSLEQLASLALGYGGGKSK
ncbi:MAG: ribosomal RNA small subunit methyltransferase A [Deltaproteobacteria bacterium]|nr:ribosomal RNA small subunit methyltransferase A [Deltaproteobacteria bacterium]